MKDSTASPVLQIVSFDIPYPPDYGGVIDVFYKIKALSELGVAVLLHCFRYGEKQEAPELEKYCRQVFYYQRPRSAGYHFSPLPFIVSTRQPKKLLERLAGTPAPILFEGLHTCAFIRHPALEKHRKLLRMHNVEWQYYHSLARLEKRRARQVYLEVESRKLRRFEKQVLDHAHVVFPISASDEQYFRKRTERQLCLLPPFHGNSKIRSRPGRGTYALYHGNLSVADNEAAAGFLISHVFRNLDYPLFIAGRQPSPGLASLCKTHPRIRLFPDPTSGEMEKLIEEAQVLILYSFQPEGVKIKLLQSLALGRFVIANSPVATGTGLEELCRIADSAADIQRAVPELFRENFPASVREKRQQLFDERFCEEKGAKMIVDLMA